MTVHRSPLRGSSLATTLLAALVMLVLVVTLGSLSLSQFHLLKGNSHRQEAENLARSALTRALDKLLVDSTLGRWAGPAPQALRAADPALTFSAHFADTPDDQVGVVTFDPYCGRPYSTNLLYGTSAVKGWRDRSVAPSTVYLVAEGKVGEATCLVESVVSLPAVPTLATQGRLLSVGGLTMGSLSGADQVPAFIADRALAQLPADLVSNDSNLDAIRLGPDTLIRGDVRTVGKVQFPSSGARVLGQVFESSKATRLMSINLSDYDPQGSGRPFTSLTTLPSNPTVSGRARYDGNLNIVGDLNLSGGLLYVNGDLAVSGGIKGKGAVICRGSVRVDAGCSLNAGHSVALLVERDVQLRGSDKLANSFQGLVYAGGALQASQMTLVGQLQARGSGASTLNQCDVVGVPQTFTVRVAGCQPEIVWRQKKVAPDGEQEGAPFTLSMENRFELYPLANGNIGATVCNRRVTANGPEMWYYPGMFQGDVDLNDPKAANVVWRKFQIATSYFQMRWPYPPPEMKANPDGTFDVEIKVGTRWEARNGYNREALFRDFVDATRGEDLVIFDPSKFYRWEDDARVSLLRVLR